MRHVSGYMGRAQFAVAPLRLASVSGAAVLQLAKSPRRVYSNPPVPHFTLAARCLGRLGMAMHAFIALLRGRFLLSPPA